MNAAELPAPQLGRILIAAGLLSEEQLAQALEEQEQTGRRLGEIIVQRGFISGPALANALAEQHGGVLKTEYGFASGLGGVVARRAASETGTSFSPLRPPDPPPMPTLRAAEPQAVSFTPEEEEAPTASEEVTPPQEQEPLERLAPAEPPAPPEPEETLDPPPLLRPAEPPAPAVEEPSEPVPPPAAVSPPSPAQPPKPATPKPQTPEPSFQPTPAAEVPEHPLETTSLRPEAPLTVEEAPPIEPEPTPPAEAAEPIPEPVELYPPAPEATREAPQPVVPDLEPQFLPRLEPEPPPAEAAEPVPEPVELRLPEPEPLLEAPSLAAPVPEPDPPHEPEPEQPVAPGLDDREELIESLRARVEAQELELAKLREQLEGERARKDVQVHVWPEEQPVATTPGPVQTEHYLLCVPTAAGYVLLDRVGGLPSVGQAVEVPEEEGRFTVTKVVRLPRNGRPCAYLQRA